MTIEHDSFLFHAFISVVCDITGQTLVYNYSLDISNANLRSYSLQNFGPQMLA